MMKPALYEALLSPAGSDRVLQDAKSGSIAAVFNAMLDYVKLAQDPAIYAPTRKHFYQRLFHLTSKTLLEALHEDGTSFSQGIQLKMVISQIEEWARTKGGPELAKAAEQQLEAPREAANAICFAPKSELLKETLRRDICPHLPPTMLASILAGYRPDSFDSEKVAPKLVEDLRKLPAVANAFDPDDFKPLEFELELTPLDFTHIQLPRLLLDRPGFAFLKEGAITFQGSLAKSAAEEEKW